MPYLPPNTYIDSFDAVNHDGDTTETMTLLGNQLTNPYLIPNMQQAYANLGITNVTVTATNQYVKFKPTTDQVSYLDSFMDAQGLEVFDAPLDYQILLEGDYYQDPSIPDSLPTWQYAVVPTNFTFPSGVQYQVLAQIHIPGDAYTAVETEAERLAGASSGNGTANRTISPNSAPPGGCPTGYVWNGSACVKSDPSPPPQATDAGIPAGAITVDETQHLPGLAISPANSNYRRAPIRKATIVARRWFKVERTYTDNNGHFQLTKHFKNKVRINIKFKNDDAIIRSMRGFRLWQMLFPLKKTFGVFDANKTNIDYNFQKWDNSVHAKGNRYWAGASVHNAVQEYKDFATTEGIGQPQGGIRILVTDLADHESGSTPMYHKRWISTVPQDFVLVFLANLTGVGGGILPDIAAVLKHEVDMTISYTGWSGLGYDQFFSDDLKTTIYHELTHAGHYVKMGQNWYTQFVNAEISEIVSNYLYSRQYVPYGNGNMSNGDEPIIALGESWAYYMGEYMTDKRYGINYSTAVVQQGVTYKNNIPVSGLSSHLNALEDFSPNRKTDPFYWIPEGLYYDLLDTRNETNPVYDQTSGFTNQQMFNAFTSSITNLQGYKSNFIQQNPNNQTTQVTALFSQYNY